MKTIILPAGATHVKYGDLAHSIADALWPDGGSAYNAACSNLDDQLASAVKSDALPVKDPLTKLPHTFPVGDALNRALVTVDDLRGFLSGTGVVVELADAAKPVKADAAVKAPKRPPTNWRHKIQEAAYEHWIRLRACGANPTRHSILGDMAKWCQDNDVKTDSGIYPQAGYIKNVVLNGDWKEPPHSIEQAKAHIMKLE